VENWSDKKLTMMKYVVGCTVNIFAYLCDVKNLQRLVVQT